MCGLSGAMLRFHFLLLVVRTFSTLIWFACKARKTRRITLSWSEKNIICAIINLLSLWHISDTLTYVVFVHAYKTNRLNRTHYSIKSNLKQSVSNYMCFSHRKKITICQKNFLFHFLFVSLNSLLVQSTLLFIVSIHRQQQQYQACQTKTTKILSKKF